MKEIVILYYVVNSMFNKFFRKMNRTKLEEKIVSIFPSVKMRQVEMGSCQITML